ncbi:MAG: hypothetical protein AAF732_19940 [Pseudomonadota bacterium]
MSIQQKVGSFARAFAVVSAIVVLLALALSTTVVFDAKAGACSNACRAAYNQCRIATKGSSRCERSYRACLRRCIRR